MNMLKICSFLLCVSFFSIGCVSTDGGDDSQLSESEVNSIVTPKPVIKIALQENQIVSAIIEKVVERQVRYPVSVEEISNDQDALGKLNLGEIDIFLGVPFRTLEQSFNEGEELHNLGFLGTMEYTAWYVPKYLLQEYPDIDSWRGFVSPEVAEVFASSETYPNAAITVTSMQDSSINNIISSFSLPMEVVELNSMASFEADIQEKISDGKPFVVAASSLDPLPNKYDLIPVALPTQQDCQSIAKSLATCSAEQQGVIKVVSPDLRDKSGLVYSLIDNFSIKNEDIHEMAAQVEEGALVEDVTDAWILENESTWSEAFP